MRRRRKSHASRQKRVDPAFGPSTIRYRLKNHFIYRGAQRKMACGDRERCMWRKAWREPPDCRTSDVCSQRSHDLLPFNRQGHPAVEGENAGMLQLYLPVYWMIMALVVLFLKEHQRRTDGLILRRVKTFCLAGTAVFALKMTKRLTQVCRCCAEGGESVFRRFDREAWGNLPIQITTPMSTFDNYIPESCGTSSIWV